VANVTSLRYLEEIRLNTQQGGPVQQENKEFDDSFTSSQIAPISTYREDKPNFMAFITFFLGILIGVAVIYYMAVPNIRQSIMEEYNRKERDYSAQLSVKDVEISSLKSNIRILESKVDDLERTLRREEGYTLIDYEPLIDVLYMYQEYLKQEAPSLEQTEELLSSAKQLNMTDITDLSAVALVNDMIEALKEKAGALYLEEGMMFYAGGDDAGALNWLEKAYDCMPDEPEVLYHLARIYHNMGDFTQAKALYEILVEDHTASTRSQEAATYLEYVNKALENAN